MERKAMIPLAEQHEALTETQQDAYCAAGEVLKSLGFNSHSIARPMRSLEAVHYATGQMSVQKKISPRLANIRAETAMIKSQAAYTKFKEIAQRAANAAALAVLAAAE
jgi:hypothetical protein